MAELDKFLRTAVANRASDLHLSSGVPASLRIDGDLVAMDLPPFESNQLQAIIFEILTESERQRFLKFKNLDKSYSVPQAGNFRVNVLMTRRGIAAVLRTIPAKVPTTSELGLPPIIEKLTELAKGLVLVTGPTGSGKSTTLAAMINLINRNYKYHILTVEDPVEFVHESQQSLINQREIGGHCDTFAEALKYALREDPDVILVGEMRDLETISLALTAAETGHLVFGTLHTRGAAASVDRIIDSFPANQQAMIRTMLSESLQAVISQSLLKKTGGQGRVAAYEIMVMNHAISNLIREGKTFQIASIMQTGRKEGMILMDQHILELVDKGMVAPEEALSYMEDPASLAGRKIRPRQNTSPSSTSYTATGVKSRSVSPAQPKEVTQSGLTSSIPIGKAGGARHPPPPGAQPLVPPTPPPPVPRALAAPDPVASKEEPPNTPPVGGGKIPPIAASPVNRAPSPPTGANQKPMPPAPKMPPPPPSPTRAGQTLSLAQKPKVAAPPPVKEPPPPQERSDTVDETSEIAMTNFENLPDENSMLEFSMPSDVFESRSEQREQTGSLDIPPLHDALGGVCEESTGGDNDGLDAEDTVPLKKQAP